LAGVDGFPAAAVNLADHRRPVNDLLTIAA
jgi:hypothetical protein